MENEGGIPVIEHTSLETISDDIEASSRTLSLEKTLRIGDGIELLELGAVDNTEMETFSVGQQLVQGCTLRRTRKTLWFALRILP